MVSGDGLSTCPPVLNLSILGSASFTRDLYLLSVSASSAGAASLLSVSSNLYLRIPGRLRLGTCGASEAGGRWRE